MNETTRSNTAVFQRVSSSIRIASRRKSDISSSFSSFITLPRRSTLFRSFFIIILSSYYHLERSDGKLYK